MKIRFLLIVSAILGTLLIASAASAYSTVDGDTTLKCQTCHTWDNGTSWHDDHKSEASSCSDCHSGDYVPVDNCKTCHTSDVWPGKPISHVASGNCTSCHTEEEEGCPAESALGPDSRSIDILKQFRDKILARHKSGRAVIKLYYTASPLLTRAVKCSPALKRMTVSLINAILPDIKATLDKE